MVRLVVRILYVVAKVIIQNEQQWNIVLIQYRTVYIYIGGSR